VGSAASYKQPQDLIQNQKDQKLFLTMHGKGPSTKPADGAAGNSDAKDNLMN
jgi:hypothetical protein